MQREQVATLRGRRGPEYSVCPVTAAGRHMLASGGDDGTVRLWDPATGERVQTVQGHRGPVTAVCPVTVSGGQLLASGGADRTVRISPATGNQQMEQN